MSLDTAPFHGYLVANGNSPVAALAAVLECDRAAADAIIKRLTTKDYFDLVLALNHGDADAVLRIARPCPRCDGASEHDGLCEACISDTDDGDSVRYVRDEGDAVVGFE